MSSLTTTTINTKDGTTNLFLRTGNTSGAQITVGTNNSIKIGNSVSDYITANSTSVSVNAATSFTNAVTITGTVQMSGGATITGTSTTTTIEAVTVNSNSYTGNTVSVVNASISTNSLNLGVPSLNMNGFSRLPNGLLFQWGTSNATSTSGDLSFPVPFTVLYSFTATPVGVVTTSASYAPQALVVNTTVAQVRTANSTTRAVYWMAIGR